MASNRIAELRRSAGYSQRGLMRRIAQLSHGQITSPSYLADIERGRRVASPFFEELAAQALGCSVFEFYGRPRLSALSQYTSAAQRNQVGNDAKSLRREVTKNG